MIILGESPDYFVEDSNFGSLSCCVYVFGSGTAALEASHVVALPLRTGSNWFPKFMCT